MLISIAHMLKEELIDGLSAVRVMDETKRGGFLYKCGSPHSRGSEDGMANPTTHEAQHFEKMVLDEVGLIMNYRLWNYKLQIL